MKKFLASAALAVFAAAGLSAQAPQPPQGPQPKVLLIVKDYRDQSAFAFALARAIQLNAAGLEVKVLFEGTPIFAFIAYNNGLERPAFKKFLEETAVSTTTLRMNREKTAKARGAKVYGGPELPHIPLTDTARFYLTQFKAKNIPYEISSNFAKSLGLLQELRSFGEKMSPDPDNPIDLVPYLRQGYIIIQE